MSDVEYELILQSQAYRCAICRKHNSEFKISLAVDHDHETESIRGILCVRCNLALGAVNDSVHILLNMIDYLKLHNTSWKEPENEN